MRIVLLLALVAATTASSIHYSPASTKIYVVKSDDLPSADAAPANTQYHEQDSGGFYSYGYSADRSAKAEYLTVDGSSKGFYSYIDADGKLQTVKYEAGGKQGFKAAATNLPKAPKAPKQMTPAPVKDTPEVQMAKKAHFEAYREAEYRAALAQKDAEAQKSAEAAQREREERLREENESILQSARADILALLRENAEAAAANNNNNNNNEDLDSIAGEGGDDSDENRLLNLSGLEQQENENGNRNNEDDFVDESDDRRAEESDNTAAELNRGGKGMTTYKLRGGYSADEQLDTRALYTLDEAKSLLQLTQLNHKSEGGYAPTKLKTTETVHVPVHSYYTVLAPTTKYSVITPTTLRAVSRDEALKRGHSLPISLSSSFLSHRLKTK